MMLASDYLDLTVKFGAMSAVHILFYVKITKAIWKWCPVKLSKKVSKSDGNKVNFKYHFKNCKSIMKYLYMYSVSKYPNLSTFPWSEKMLSLCNDAKTWGKNNNRDTFLLVLSLEASGKSCIKCLLMSFVVNYYKTVWLYNPLKDHWC